MAISNTVVTTGDGLSIFTCPGTPGSNDQEFAVTCIVFCNTSASAVTLDLYAVPSTVETKSTATQIIKELSIPAKETFTFDTEKFVLGSQDRLWAVCSAAGALTATVSSMRVS